MPLVLKLFCPNDNCADDNIKQYDLCEFLDHYALEHIEDEEDDADAEYECKNCSMKFFCSLNALKHEAGKCGLGANVNKSIIKTRRFKLLDENRTESVYSALEHAIVYNASLSAKRNRKQSLSECEQQSQSVLGSEISRESKIENTIQSPEERQKLHSNIDVERTFKSQMKVVKEEVDDPSYYQHSNSQTERSLADSLCGISSNISVRSFETSSVMSAHVKSSCSGNDNEERTQQVIEDVPVTNKRLIIKIKPVKDSLRNSDVPLGRKYIPPQARSCGSMLQSTPNGNELLVAHKNVEVNVNLSNLPKPPHTPLIAENDSMTSNSLSVGSQHSSLETGLKVVILNIPNVAQEDLFSICSSDLSHCPNSLETGLKVVVPNIPNDIIAQEDLIDPRRAPSDSSEFRRVHATVSPSTFPLPPFIAKPTNQPKKRRSIHQSPPKRFYATERVPAHMKKPLVDNIDNKSTSEKKLMNEIVRGSPCGPVPQAIMKNEDVSEVKSRVKEKKHKKDKNKTKERDREREKSKSVYRAKSKFNRRSRSNSRGENRKRRHSRSPSGCRGRSPSRFRKSPSRFRRSPSRFCKSPSRFRRSPSRFRRSPTRFRRSKSRSYSSRDRTYSPSKRGRSTKSKTPFRRRSRSCSRSSNISKSTNSRHNLSSTLRFGTNPGFNGPSVVPSYRGRGRGRGQWYPHTPNFHNNANQMSNYLPLGTGQGQWYPQTPIFNSNMQQIQNYDVHAGHGQWHPQTPSVHNVSYQNVDQVFPLMGRAQDSETRPKACSDMEQTRLNKGLSEVAVPSSYSTRQTQYSPLSSHYSPRSPHYSPTPRTSSPKRANRSKHHNADESFSSSSGVFGVSPLPAAPKVANEETKKNEKINNILNRFRNENVKLKPIDLAEAPLLVTQISKSPSRSPSIIGSPSRSFLHDHDGQDNEEVTPDVHKHTEQLTEILILDDGMPDTLIPHNTINLESSEHDITPSA